MSQCPDFHFPLSALDKPELQKMHTKQLINRRNSLYYVSEYCRDMYCSSDIQCQQCYYNRNEEKRFLKQILKTREHVPNKEESRALRKARIKKGI